MKMNYKYLILFMFVLYQSVLAGPVLRGFGLSVEELEPEEKIREKRKVELLQHLQEKGVGVKKVVKEEEVEEVSQPEISLDIPPETVASEEEVTRSKKYAVDSVCIKEVGSTGKTSCGRMISARGPGARTLLRSNPDMSEMEPMKMDRYPSMESRTFDSILPLSSLASSVTYAVPTTYTDTATIGHTIATPALAAPALPLAPLAHVEPISLLSHSIPLPMHSLHAMLATRHPLLNFQRIELPKFPEVIYTPTEIKQPAYEVNSVVTTRPAATPIVYPSHYGVVNSGYSGYGGKPMICHPYDEKFSQQVIQIKPEVHVIDSDHKTINDSIEEFKSGSLNSDEERKVHEHLRQVSEIREEINQLNRAAQKIVDQQERLAEMQQKYLWKNGEKIGYINPHDLRMYMVPPSYSRANALAYPNSADDFEFFMNMLKTGKKIGILSETFQPPFLSTPDAIKMTLSGEQSSQNGASQAGTNQDSKAGQQSNNGNKISKI